MDFENLNYVNVFEEYDKIDKSSISKKDKKTLHKKIKDIQQKWDNTNQIYKINVINALYGIIAQKDSPIHNPRNAEAVTASGQLCIRGVSDYLDLSFDDGSFVFYNDTDSTFISVDKIDKNLPIKEFHQKIKKYTDDKIIPNIKDFFTMLAGMLNTENKIKMDVETICDQLIMHTPKKYIARKIEDKGLAYNREDYMFKIKGMEIVRSDTPQWVKDKIMYSLRLIFDSTNDDLLDYIKTCKEDFKNLDIREISKPTSVQDMEKYKFMQKGCPRHVKSSQIYNRYLEENNLTEQYQLIYSGSKISECYLKPKAIDIIGLDSIAFNVNDDIPESLIELIKPYIDYDLMWEKVFLKPLERLVGDVGWSLVKINNFLDEL
jgi:hypothetical protein